MAGSETRIHATAVVHPGARLALGALGGGVRQDGVRLRGLDHGDGLVFID